MTVGERIKKIRQDNAISQTDLANACKISKQTLYKYENNIITNIPSDKIELIADYLSVSPALIMGWEDKEQAVPLPQTNVFMRPVYDSISAGFGVIAQDVPVDYMPTYITCPSEQDKYIWINVHGDSMSPPIDDGSKILIKKQTSVDSGQIAAVLVDDEEAVVKKILYNDNTVELHSVNPYYPPRVFKNNDVTRVQILGLVKEVSKSLQ